MVAEVSIRGAPPAGHPTNVPSAGTEAVGSAPAEKAPAPAVPQKPKVSAPKPNEIKFDPAEACALVVPGLGKLCLLSNNGSLYLGQKAGAWVFVRQVGEEPSHQGQ